MAISEVIKFGGSPDDIVWKHSGEEFNATSQLIVDEVQEAILCVNGQATDLFGPGRHTLSVPNIPIARKLVNIPTGGTTPFPCKVFYINIRSLLCPQHFPACLREVSETGAENEQDGSDDHTEEYETKGLQLTF